MIHTRLIRAAGACLLLSAAVACGDDDGNAPPPPGGFTLTLATTAASVVQGAAITPIAATIARNDPFEGPVTLAVESANGGITGSFDPAIVPAGASTSALTVSVADTVTPGDYPLTIRGTATGITDQTVTLTLTVTAAPASAGFTLSAAPESLSIAQGGRDSTLATVARTGSFADTVTLAVTGLPDSVTATIGAAALGGDTTTIVFEVGDAVVPGTYSAVVGGTGTGVSAVEDTITLTITEGAAYALVITPDSIGVTQGQGAQASISLSRDSGFVAPVAISVDSLPAGLVATIADPALTGDSTSLDVTVDSAVAAGTYPIVVRGNTAGRAERVDTLQLTVSASVASAISISLSADSVSIEQGSDSTLAVIVARTAFTDSVHLAVTGAPAGATVTTTSTVGDTATVTITVADSTVPGAYNLVVVASGAGIADATIPLALTVAAKPSSIGQSSCSSCGAVTPKVRVATAAPAPPALSHVARQARGTPSRVSLLASAPLTPRRPASTPTRGE